MYLNVHKNSLGTIKHEKRSWLGSVRRMVFLVLRLRDVT